MTHNIGIRTTDSFASILNTGLKTAPIINIGLKILDPRAKVPTQATTGSSGYDLYALLEEGISGITIAPGQTVKIGTGISINIQNPSFGGFIFPRSGLGHKHGIVLGNLTGVIDSDYQNELMVSVWNRSQVPYSIQHGDRIAQLVILPVFHANFQIQSEFELSGRNGGFGSTGV